MAWKKNNARLVNSTVQVVMARSYRPHLYIDHIGDRELVECNLGITVPLAHRILGHNDYVGRSLGRWLRWFVTNLDIIDTVTTGLS
jgi:hypothetical protein